MMITRTTGRRRVTRRTSAGFTLAEFLVSSTVMLIIIAMSMGLLHQGQALFRSQAASLMTQAKVRKAINLMITDLRSTGCKPVSITSGTTPGLIAATATSVRVVADLNGNGITNGTAAADASDDVTFAYDSVNGRLTRLAANDSSYGNQAVTMIDQVKSLTIRYYDDYDASGSPVELTPTDLATAANRARVTRILVTIVAAVNEGNQEKGTLTIESPIALRNRQLDAF